MRWGADQGPGILVVERGGHPGQLRVIGEVDASNVDYFASVLMAESHRAPIVTVDVRRLRFLGGDGLRAVVRTARGLHGRGGALHLVGPNPLVRRLFTVLSATTAPGLMLLEELPDQSVARSSISQA